VYVRFCSLRGRTPRRAMRREERMIMIHDWEKKRRLIAKRKYEKISLEKKMKRKKVFLDDRLSNLGLHLFQSLPLENKIENNEKEQR
jgi:hypothetical protein